jgi:hypothetical protein
MGIKLDWQVESEQTEVRAIDDPEARRIRREARRRLLLIILGIVVVLGGLGAYLIWRVQRADNRLRQDLIDTALIEITALRIGDLSAYMEVQRSASDAFIFDQNAAFEQYQQLKQARRIEFTDEIVSAAINGKTGRVVAREIIDGVPYNVVRYYWHYEDSGGANRTGWRRVPDDYTFWGRERAIDADHTRIEYFELDAPLARALAAKIEDWWTRGCALIACPAALPALTVEIVPQPPANAVEWSDGWTLRIHSPLVDRARADIPLTPALEQVIAQRLGQRLIATATTPPLPFTDAIWLRDDLARWLGEALLYGDAAPGGFTESLIALYGANTAPNLLAALNNATMLDGFVFAVTGFQLPLLPVDQLNAIRWESFFQWRLELETQLLTQPDGSGAFRDLYDLENVNAANNAAIRLESPQYAALGTPVVTGVTIQRDELSQTFAWAQVTRADGSADTIVWRAAGNTWKRVN